MAVDPTKPRKILVVHGVQTGTDEDIHVDKKIEELVKSRLGDIPVNFETEAYKYENINDEAQEKYEKVLSFFMKRLIDRVPFGNILGTLMDSGVDLVGDVVIAVKDGSTAKMIRDGLIEQIEQIYEDGNPLYIVAHSLGTIYSFDAVNHLITNDKYFKRNSRRTWPVQALITMGSPIGLSMFDRNRVEELGEGRKYFRWINFWARTDPVVSGSFYGKPQEGYQIAEKFSTNSKESGWFINDRVIDTGGVWLQAHVSYWNHPGIGDELCNLISS